MYSNFNVIVGSLNCAPVRPDAGVVAEARVVVPVGRVGEGALQSEERRKFNINLLIKGS